MKIFDTIFKIVFWTAFFVVVVAGTFCTLYYAYRSLEGREQPLLESEYIEPLPDVQGTELEPCVESEPERIVIQELIKSKQLCEDALNIYQQIEKVREQLEDTRNN